MPRFQIFSLIAFLLLTIALGFIGISHTRQLNQLQGRLARFQQEATRPQLQSPTSAPENQLQASLSAILSRLDRLESQSPTPKPTIPAKPRASGPIPFQKQVLTFGSANTINTSWTHTNLEMIVDSADYPSSVLAYFEAGLNTVNGVAWARLTNKTTGAVISASEVSHNTNTVAYVKSLGFKLHPGSNNYVVELRSTSGETVFLSSSRLILE